MKTTVKVEIKVDLYDKSKCNIACPWYIDYECWLYDNMSIFDMKRCAKCRDNEV